jgi:hypothetical protein
VGRCNRESSCGYHLTPKQYFETNGIEKPKFTGKPVPDPIPLPVDFMPIDYVEKSLNGFSDTHFAKYLISLFGEEIAKKALLRYLVGRSKLDAGKANIFWRIDIENKVRTGKIMFYNPGTGKRIKDKPPTWAHSHFKGFNYALCFFGEHLLTERPENPVGIVESEKTAIIASIFMPGIVWLATGGASGCKWREYAVYKVLQDRDVTLFPDFGLYNKKTEKTCFQEWQDRADHIAEKMNYRIKVSRALEDGIPEAERCNDFDLSDMLIKRDLQTGHALTDEGYPVMWDIR